MATTKEFPTGFAAVDRMKLKMGANFKAKKGTIAAIAKDGASQGCVVEGAQATNLLSIGRFNETVDNTGGAAGAKEVEVLFHRKFELLKMANDNVAPVVSPDDIGAPVFIKDNNTISADGTNRSVAGIAWKVADGLVWYEPASRYLPAEAEDAALDARVDDLEAANAILAVGEFPIPLTTFVDPDGDPLAKFADTVPGFNLANSEAFGIRWANEATPPVVMTQVNIPDDLDEGEDLVLRFLCSKSGATVGDATKILAAAFLIAEGDLHDADADAGGESTNALVGDAPAKTTDALLVTIAAANIPAGVNRTMTLTIKPKNGTLGTDDLILHSARGVYARKQA